MSTAQELQTQIELALDETPDPLTDWGWIVHHERDDTIRVEKFEAADWSTKAAQYVTERSLVKMLRWLEDIRTEGRAPVLILSWLGREWLGVKRVKSTHPQEPIAVE